MSDQFEWSEEQWNRVRQVVHDEALRARVAASFLPLFGPLPADTQAVPINKLDSKPGVTRLTVDDYTTMRLTTLSVNVYLKNAQVADPELASAILMFRRAADIVARLEDIIVFNGQQGVGQGPKNPPKTPSFTGGLPAVFNIGGGHTNTGLVGAGKQQTHTVTVPKGHTEGQAVFSTIVKAIQGLEEVGQYGPFACVMGDALFSAINEPMQASMVLPRDSILPMLDGPLLRSSALEKNKAVLVALQGSPVEIVVPNDITVRYMQTTPDAEHVFRVQQKFALRVKDEQAVSLIEL